MRRPRKSQGRRVSFAEVTSLHIIPRDDEHETPPHGDPGTSPRRNGTRRRSPRIAARMSDPEQQSMVVVPSLSVSGRSKRKSKRPSADGKDDSEAVKHERPNVATDDGMELEAKKSEASAPDSRVHVAKQESRAHRYLTCKVPGNIAFAKGFVVREVMQNLERMGLKGLVNRPWQLESKFACQEYVDFVYGQRAFPANHRVHHAKFDKDALVALYDLPSTGTLGCPPPIPSKFFVDPVSDAFPSGFFTDPEPTCGWDYSHLRGSRLKSIFMVLNPIFHPNECDRIKRSTALAICRACGGEKIDWAGFLSRRLSRLAQNFASPRNCYLSPFLLHSYEKAGALTDTERLQFGQKQRLMRQEARNYAREHPETSGKQKPLTQSLERGFVPRDFLHRDVLQSQRTKDDTLSKLKCAHALNMSHISSAVAKVQNLLNNFENAGPTGLENLVKRKLEELLTDDQNVVRRLLFSEMASASDAFDNNLGELKKELERLFVLARRHAQDSFFSKIHAYREERGRKQDGGTATLPL